MKNITISLCETHHKKNSKPLYSKRFDRVQSFHFPPGYAPVEINKTSFFINELGEMVFERIFINAFGFYEGIATVSDKSGFFHINEQGEDIHQHRFKWAGNFQENFCVVQDIKSNLFFHINRKGNNAYQKKYSYTGDYKYGVAVVVNESGLSTHIDTKGKSIHGKYFLQLSVYHKGYAIAKDEYGYFHIDKQGKEIYSNRFSELEPFYNGRAVAIDHYNVKMLISPKGDILQKIDKPYVQEQKIKSYFSKKAFDYWNNRILSAILELDVLEKFESTLNKEGIYQHIDLPHKSVDMIVRWLVLKKIIYLKNNFYSLTLLGRTILKESKLVYLYWQSHEMIKTSSYMASSLREHVEYFSHKYKVSFFEYIKNNGEMREKFSAILNYYSNDYQNHLQLLKLTTESVCDVGGGNGILLEKLKQKYPEIKPIILDKYSYNQNNNIDFFQADFFQEWNLKANVYILSRILHDWNDEQVIQILSNIAKNMDKLSILYIFETIIDEKITVDKGISISFHLLNLLGGRERTLSEYKIIFCEAGLTIKQCYLKNETISLIKVMKQRVG